MDNLAEDMESNPDLGVQFSDVIIRALLYVDDAITIAEGYDQQELTLNEASDFAVKHKFSWGPKKCRTVEVGSHKEERSSWKLGDHEISKCDSYKYLGDYISRDGKDAENLKERGEKAKAVVRTIITCCKSEIMVKIGVTTMIRLHEAETIPTLLYNAETWTLTATEKKSLDLVEIAALKKIVGLRQTTPTAGIILTTGTMFTTIRIEIKQLLFLQRILRRENSQWTKALLINMKEENISWAKQIEETLEKWNLETDWEQIEKKSVPQWKNEVLTAAEEQNANRLLEECRTKLRGEIKSKTKTKYVETLVNEPSYERAIDPVLVEYPSITYARALIMARFGMLQCANNYSVKYGSKMCKKCNEIDDESHRINYCQNYTSINFCDNDEKINFEDIFSSDVDGCYEVLRVILSMWDLENGKNEMRCGE